MSINRRNVLDVFVVGDYCLDFVFTGLPGQPMLGSEIEAKNFNMTPGGACNAAIAMHRLGLSVGWAADFGNDEISQIILEFLRKEQFPTNLFEYHKGSCRNVTASLSFTEERAFVAFYDHKKFIPSSIKHLPLISTKLIYIPGLFYGSELKWGKNLLNNSNTMIFMDGNSNKNDTLAMSPIKKALQTVDIISLNAKEACQLANCQNLLEAARLIAEYCDHVIVKNGKNGALALWDGVQYQSDAIRVKVVDTTGAGDCFNAGFIKAYLLHKTIQECLEWGNIVGGLSTQGLGGVERVIRLEDIIKRLKR